MTVPGVGGKIIPPVVTPLLPGQTTIKQPTVPTVAVPVVVPAVPVTQSVLISTTREVVDLSTITEQPHEPVTGTMPPSPAPHINHYVNGALQAIERT